MHVQEGAEGALQHIQEGGGHEVRHTAHGRWCMWRRGPAHLNTVCHNWQQTRHRVLHHHVLPRRQAARSFAVPWSAHLQHA